MSAWSLPKEMSQRSRPTKMGLRDASAQVESSWVQGPTRDKRPSTGPREHNNKAPRTKIIPKKDKVSWASKRGTRAEAPGTIDDKIEDQEI